MFHVPCCILDLTQNWDKEKNEVERLEKEKKEWLSRGISAEFEKKDRVSLFEIDMLQ